MGREKKTSLSKMNNIFSIIIEFLVELVSLTLSKPPLVASLRNTKNAPALLLKTLCVPVLLWVELWHSAQCFTYSTECLEFKHALSRM